MIHNRSHRYISHWTLLIGLITLSVSCTSEETDAPAHFENLRFAEPLTLQRHLIAFDETRGLAWVTDTRASALAPTTQTLDPAPWVIETNADASSVFVLAAESRSLTIITPDSPSRTFDIESPYNALDISEDGRFVILWYRGDLISNDEIFNPNAYAVVDLESGAVTQRSLRSFGDSPLDVIFMPSLTFSDRDTPIYHALFLFDSYVTFAELSEESSYEITAQLKLEATERAVIPKSVLFSEWSAEDTNGGRFVYLTAQGSSDVYALNLLEEPDLEGVMRLKPSINQLPSGANPERMIRYRGADEREKLLVVNSGDQSISVIDAATASALPIPLGTAADQIYAYTAPSGEELALIYSERGQSTIVTFARLEALEDRRGQALTQLELEAPITELIDSPLEGQAIALHQSARGLSLINLDQVFATPLRAGDVGVSSWVLDRDRALIYTSVRGSGKLTTINLETSQVRAVDVERAIERITLIPESDTLLLTHAGSEGNFTVINTGNITEEASSFYGAFYLRGAI